MPRLKDVKAERTNLVESLVKEYGEGAVISRQEIIEHRNKKKLAASANTILNSTMHKVFRGQYIITKQRDPKQVREAIKKAKDRLRSPTSNMRKAAGKQTHVHA